ncbi:MAG: methyltransferase domain-containing protein [Proteobacteria bacterium]|nr:methyltransferase domain-containing protein [Pseudomonadota bacterium]
MHLPDHHLDLGCGQRPRNPYGRAHLAGVDIRGLSGTHDFDYRTANLAVQPIPFPDDRFGSVSAFDFLEHVPRILATPDGRDTCFPFIRLMDEIWRVLAPGGLFYALTPAFPHPEAFVDPTHVNIITEHTHDYFCGEQPLARMYGFGGRFQAKRVDWVHYADAYAAAPGVAGNRPQHTGLKRLSRELRAASRRMRGRDDPARRQAHLRWELEAIKDRSR